MSFYNWIQEKLFDNYEEWRMKSPDYNRNGFNIVGIDNTLKAMHDGFSCIWSYILLMLLMVALR